MLKRPPIPPTRPDARPIVVDCQHTMKETSRFSEHLPLQQMEEGKGKGTKRAHQPISSEISFNSPKKRLPILLALLLTILSLLIAFKSYYSLPFLRHHVKNTTPGFDEEVFSFVSSSFPESSSLSLHRTLTRSSIPTSSWDPTRLIWIRRVLKALGMSCRGGVKCLR